MNTEEHSLAESPRRQDEEPRFRILLTLGYLRRTAGPTTGVLAEATEFAKASCEPWLLATDSKHVPAARELISPEVNDVVISVRPCFGLYFRPGMKATIADLVGRMDIVHCHALWAATSRYACAAARRLAKPYFISPHGACNRFALSQKAWKKRLATWAYQRKDFDAAACVHALTQSELIACREFGIRTPIAVIPNGVDLPMFDQIDEGAFELHYPRIKGKRVCLSMSRLHPVKGLTSLVEAWAALRDRLEDWHLILAGPDAGHGETLRKLVGELGLVEDVTFTGNLSGSEKVSALRRASVFVLPSLSEGFSNALLEAMACSLPVLMTHACNFPEAAEQGAAIEISPGKQHVLEGLERMLSLDSDELAAMGRKGRAMIESDYTWAKVIDKSIELYNWVVSGGKTPAFVSCDH